MTLPKISVANPKYLGQPPQGSLYTRYHTIQNQIIHTLKLGDILIRYSPHYMYGMFDLAPTFCHIAQTEFTHAGIITDFTTGGDVLITEYMANRIQKTTLYEFLYPANRLCFVRVMLPLNTKKKAVRNATRSLLLQEKNFNNHDFHCCKFVASCYNSIRDDICPPVRFCDLPNWKPWMSRFINEEPEDLCYCAGNEKFGFLSSKLVQFDNL